MKRKHSRSAVSSPAVHAVSYRRRRNVNNLLAPLTSHRLLIQRAHVLWFLKNHLTCIHRFLICDLGGVVGKASLRLNSEQLRSVNASSGKTKAQLPRPSPTPSHPCHQWHPLGDEDSGLREGSCTGSCSVANGDSERLLSAQCH